MAKLNKKDKADIIKALKAAEVEVTGEETDKELIALAENLETNEDEVKANGKVEDEDKEDEDDESDDSVDVLKRDNGFVRTFSKAVHGAKFKELAEEFVNNPNYSARGYRIVPSKEVKKVIVRYREKEDFELPLDKQKPDAPMVDKERVFTDKEAAISFGNQKKATVVVSRKVDKVK